jgi:hypothetical protein
LVTAARAFVIFLLVFAILPSSPTVSASPALRRVWMLATSATLFACCGSPSNRLRNRGACDGPGISLDASLDDSETAKELQIGLAGESNNPKNRGFLW